MALTESGSFLIHYCLTNENVVHFKKAEILSKYLGLANEETGHGGEQSAKRAKFSVTRQINSCSWPDPRNIFLGISMIKEKKCILLWLKVKNLLSEKRSENSVNKDNFVEHYQKIDLELDHYANPICLIESKILRDSVCLIAIAMDDGLISVLVFDLEKGETKRNIKLARHNDQICSLSIDVTNQKRFPLGLLASVSRDGLMLIWDIENEFYFADYQAIIETRESASSRRSNSHINWFSLAFINHRSVKQTFVAISNQDSGVTLLEVPENTRSKVRLKEAKDASRKPNPKSKQQNTGSETGSLKHNALIFNMEYNNSTNTLITSSLDGNHILWEIRESGKIESKPVGTNALCIKPEYLIPAMLNNSRTHMLRSSPIREDLLCLAIGKAGLRFHKIVDKVIDCKFDMSSSCSHIARKITKANVSPTSVAWHPCHEYRLAIGTIEGKVLRADITPRKAVLVEAEYCLSKNSSKLATKPSHSSGDIDPMKVDDIFDVHYQPIDRNVMVEEEDAKNDPQPTKEFKTDGIYSLCWGPHPADPQDVSKSSIYAVGSMSNRLFIYCSARDNNDRLTNYLDEFTDYSLPEASDQASEVAWKPTMDLMALGTRDGRILIVSYLDEAHEDRSKNRLFKRIAVIQGPFGSTFIQCLAWHPTINRDSAHYYYLAASSNDSPVFVFNLKESILVSEVKVKLKLENHGNGDLSVEPSAKDQDCDLKSCNTILSAYINKLDGHTKAISDIAWNPHELDQLATSSFDRICYVWSIDDRFLGGKILSKFFARDRLFTLEWSLVDTDLLFTSGHDSTIWAWRPSENLHQSND